MTTIASVLVDGVNVDKAALRNYLEPLDVLISSVGTGAASTQNTACGVDALALTTNSAAQGCTAFGYQALSSNVSGIGLTAFGNQALKNCVTTTTQPQCTAVGHMALTANTTGTGNTAVGSGTLQANTTGSQLTAIGIAALSSNTTGSQNTAVGDAALQFETTGTYNVAVGNGALTTLTTGSSNVAVGGLSLQTSNAGIANTALGNQALKVSTSNYNTAVGADAGKTLTTGQNNLYLGFNAQPSSPTASNEMIFGDGNVAEAYLGQNGQANLHCSDISMSNGTVTAAVPNNTATTVYALQSSSRVKCYIIAANVESGTLNPNSYSAFMIVLADNTPATKIVSQTGSTSLNLTLSGLNVQATQTSGAPAIVNVSVLEMLG